MGDKKLKAAAKSFALDGSEEEMLKALGLEDEFNNEQRCFIAGAAWEKEQQKLSSGEDEFEQYIRSVIEYSKNGIFTSSDEQIQIKLLVQVLEKYHKFKPKTNQ
jgi:hypothetical protein